MGLASLASTLYSIQSRKNVPLRTAFSMMVREDLATRFSVFNLVKTVTKSEFLATVAHAKYGKKTPLQKEEEKEKQKQKQIELKKQQRLQKFERFTANSIAYLNRKVILLETITQKNTELITSIYNDLGYFKGQRKINIGQINPKSIRAPMRSKSVKGNIDKINEEIQKLKAVKLTKVIKPTDKKPKEKKEPKKEQNILLDLLGSIATNPLLLAAIARGGIAGAVSLGAIGASIGSAVSLPKNLGMIKDRMEGKEIYQDPFAEKISQGITPVAGGLGVGAAVGIGTELKRLYGRKKSVRAERKLKQFDKNDKVLQKLMARGMSEKEALAVQKSRMGTAFKIERTFTKWGKLSKLFYGFSRALPALTAAEVVYEIGKISNYVSQRATNKISESEFKKSVSKSLGEIITTVGPTTLGGIIGAAAGTALFPGAGTLSLGGIGATLGGIVSLFLPDESEEKMGEWLYGLLFEDKTAGTPPSAKSAAESSEAQPSKSVPKSSEAQPSAPYTPSGIPATQEELKKISVSAQTGTAKEAMDFFMSGPGGGYSLAVAAGIVGNLIQESNLKTNAKNEKEDAYGIAQWRGDRKTKFTEVFNKPIEQSTFEEQLKYVAWELNNPKSAEYKVGRKLRDMQTPTTAALYIDKYYERSSGADARKRSEYAEQLFAKDYRDRAARRARDNPSAIMPEVVLQPLDSTLIGSTIQPPPLNLMDDQGAVNEEMVTNLIQSQIQSEAALIAATQMQNQINVISSETIKIRNNIEQDESFPSSANPDLDEYIQDAILETIHTRVSI